jgi:hypothetical protein
MTQQPEWKLVYATDYSALYVDATGVYGPELQIAQTDDDADADDIDATVAYVYRFELERCYRVTRDDGSSFLCSQDPAREHELPHPLGQYVPRFAKSLGDVARSVGSTVEDLIEALCCEDPGTRAEVYEAIGSYHGYDNLDSYPAEWTAHEFEQWPERGERLKSDERDAFTQAYISCALWANALAYKHDGECPCDDDPSDPDACICDPYPELVSAADAGGPEPTPDDLTDDACEHMTRDAHDFYAANVRDLRASTLSMEQAGHDFSLTRNRHGAGFWDWDRKHISKDADAALDRLTDAAHAYGEQSLIVGDDGKVSVM